MPITRRDEIVGGDFTSSAAIVTVEEVLMTGTTANASCGIPVKEAKRKIADGTEPKKSEAPDKNKFPIEAFLKLKPYSPRNS